MARLSAPPPVRRPRLFALALFLLLALVGNGTVLDAHFHPGPRVAGVTALADKPDANDGPCALCDSIAAIDPLLPTDAPVLAGPVRGATALYTPGHVAAAHVRPVHSWHSRAPPVLRSA